MGREYLDSSLSQNGFSPMLNANSLIQNFLLPTKITAFHQDCLLYTNKCNTYTKDGMLIM